MCFKKPRREITVPRQKLFGLDSGARNVFVFTNLKFYFSLQHDNHHQPQNHQPSNTEQLERFAMILPVVLKHHTKTNNTSAILKYYGTILPLFSQIESETHKIMVCAGSLRS